MEGNLSGLLQGGEDHADHPEEDDVVACHQHVRGIEILQFRRLFRPAKGREGPEGGAEPGVQSILVLADLRAAAVRGQTVTSSPETVIFPQSPQYHAGILWPHQSWREMHQS